MSKQELRNLIILFQENSLITLSWGMCDILESSKGIKFFVNGRKYKGLVLVDIMDDYYVVTVDNKTHKSSRTNLIKTIDNLVEFDSDFYNLSKKCVK